MEAGAQSRVEKEEKMEEAWGGETRAMLTRLGGAWGWIVAS